MLKPLKLYSFYILLILAPFIGVSQGKFSSSPVEFNPTFKEFPVSCSIRALDVVDKNHVWYAGSNNQFGYTKDGGDHWTIDSIDIITKSVDFRSIAVTNHSVFLLNAGSPAWLLQSTDDGKSWRIVHTDDHPDVFYDSMNFWDDENGIAFGDPIDGCLSILVTRDGGESWKKLDCPELPPAFQGEAAFAASNTNIAIADDHVWLATGGTESRIFHSPNQGRSWEVFNTPIVHGGAMTGIFSVAFYDTMNGVVFGGDWEEQSINVSNKAITKDGGVTWQLINDGKTPGYRSCVQYMPNSKGEGIIAIGIPGISYSLNGGESWQDLDYEYYYTVRLARSGKVAWLAGKNKIARMAW
jgi:photosystem II stability/assembly factor-like uncharacterized protein